MKFKAEINVMPLKELLDPQGKAVASSMKNIDLPEVKDVRIGKRIILQLEAADKTQATAKVEQACKKLLANPVMEYFEFEISEEN